MNLKFSLWFAALITLLCSTYYSFELGWLHYVWAIDVSKLSFVSFALFFIFFGRLGLCLYKGKTKDKDLEPGYVAGNWAMAFGLLGTAIGLIFMTHTLVDIDFSNLDSIRDSLKLVSSGMSTALYTTIAGLVTKLGLEISHYLVERI